MGGIRISQERIEEIKEMLVAGYKQRSIREKFHCSSRIIARAKEELLKEGHTFEVERTSTRYNPNKSQIPEYMWMQWDERVARIRRYYERARKSNA